MRTERVSAAEFKARCLGLMDRIQHERTEIVITRRGRPIAKLVPFEEVPQRSVFGCLAGTGKVVGDIVSPLEVAWDAEHE